jgi:hypothetical protein
VSAEGFIPSLNSLGGVGATYNTGSGARVAQDDFTAAALNNDSVFASNTACGLFNTWPFDPVQARNNQWRGGPPPTPIPDTCETQGGGPVDLGTIQDQNTQPILISGIHAEQCDSQRPDAADHRKRIQRRRREPGRQSRAQPDALELLCRRQHCRRRPGAVLLPADRARQRLRCIQPADRWRWQLRVTEELGRAMVPARGESGDAAHVGDTGADRRVLMPGQY